MELLVTVSPYLYSSVRDLFPVSSLGIPILPLTLRFLILT